MVHHRTIIRAIVIIAVAIPFALLLIYFLQQEFNWQISSAAAVVTVVVAIIFGILEIMMGPHRSGTADSSEPGVSEDGEMSAEVLMDYIFGPETEIEVFEDTQAFAEKIQQEADDAINSVDRIHFNMHYVNRLEQNLSNPQIRHRILLVKPVYSDDETASGNTGQSTGLESVYESNIDTNPSIDQFIERFEFIDTALKEGRWEGTEIKLYETTPWFRATIIDQNKAGFLVQPSMYEGTKAAKFWTEDPNVVDTLGSIYDDIWEDPRTVQFEDWYDDGSKLVEKDSP